MQTMQRAASQKLPAGPGCRALRTACSCGGARGAAGMFAILAPWLVNTFSAPCLHNMVDEKAHPQLLTLPCLCTVVQHCCNELIHVRQHVFGG